MEKIKLIIEVSELLSSKIAGKLSQAEKVLLDKWLNSSQQNRKLYRKILDNNNISERNRLYESVNVEQAWKKISGVLIARPKRSFLHTVFKYAASILIPILLGIFTYWYMNDKPVESDNSIVEIHPGSHDAVLVMDNGRNVDLTSGEVKRIVEKDGTVIKNDEKALNYAGQLHEKSKKNLINTLIVPRGGEYNLVLSDGSKVFINSMSKLIFPVQFSGDKREITLEEGEAYFEVSKNKSKPFIVTVKGVQVEVLGTSFNIKAYQEDAYSYTTLVEGKVKLSTNDQSSKPCFLEPNQQAVFDPFTSGLIVHKVDAIQEMQWVTGKYSFTNQSLDEIMKTLSRWYDFNYQYEDKALKQIRFEGGLNRYESIDPILDIISKTGKVHVEVEGKEIIFSRI